MHGLIRNLMALGAVAAFLALVGCNSAPTPAPAPAPATVGGASVQPAAAVAAAAGPTILLHKIAPSPYYEVHHKVLANDMVTWKSNDGLFYIQFDKGHNPCSETSTTVGTVEYYKSGPAGGTPQTVTCTIKNSLGAGTWVYGASSTPPSRHITQCTGCTLELD
jgi:hypothetical protein